MLKDAEAGYAKVEALLANSIVLLCGCSEVSKCHRAVVAALIAEKSGLPIRHLDPATFKMQAALSAAGEIEQPSLFPDHPAKVVRPAKPPT